ncbi:hypothetical protein [Arenibacter certesii]|uniref:Type II toxin-antitoxin system RelE/ParE family toxin n=1 Tax=Arenibacter certesii TaxID=228955 RepID=A0A918MHR8_9FLAO|nr:hypothetical protein [Arenibacter certesii]GGW26863.1 hypothetical protein GCM10007383_10190 [Arenibacter certesii]
MRSGYKILWTDHALTALEETIKYLETNWTERELRNFSAKPEHTIELLSKTPELFPSSTENWGFEKPLLKNTIIYVIGFIMKILKSYPCSLIDKIRKRKEYNTAL